MAQELEDLLIKVDSECGDLNGIDSAISALSKLSQFSANASKGAISLDKMSTALTQLNNYGKGKSNADKTVKDIEKLKGALGSLAEFTKDANKTIKQLDSLGKALQSFTNIGVNLKGINEVTGGISKMIDVLEKLSKVEKDATTGIRNIKKLGEALHAFNGLDDNVKGINDVALGLLNLSKATESFKKNDAKDFSYITSLGKALNAFTDTMNGRKWGFVGQATQGIANLTDALKDTKNVDVGAIGAIANELKKFGDKDIAGSSERTVATLQILTKTFQTLGSTSSTVQDTMDKLVSGFQEADRGFYNVRASIEAITTDLDDSLKPIKNSNLFETLEKFKHLNDSYKNVGGLGQGLGSLISALDMLNGRDLQTKGLTQLFDYLKALSSDSSIESALQKFEKIGALAQPVASILNALKYTDFDEKNNVLTILGTQIKAFYDALPTNMDKFSYVFYALRDIINLAKDTSVSLPENNVIAQLGKSLESFKGLDGIQNIQNLAEGLKSLSSWLHIMGNDSINVEPILVIGEALTKLSGMGQGLNNFKIMVNNLKGLMKMNVSNLNGLELVLERLFDTLNVIPDGKIDALKDLGSVTRALDRLQEADPSKLNLIADALAKILNSLGSIQGSNNKISIKLDGSGVATFQKVVTSANRTWDDFANHLKQNIKDIDISSMFDTSAPLRQLERSLAEAERMLQQRLKTITEEYAKMQTTVATRQNYKDSSVFQTQVSKWAIASAEANQLRTIIERLHVAIEKAPRFNNENEGLKYIRNLKEEYERYASIMKQFNNGENADSSSRMGRGFQAIKDRMVEIEEEIKKAQEDLDAMPETLQDASARAAAFADELERASKASEKIEQETRNSIGKGFTQFGQMLSGGKGDISKSLGKLSTLFGKGVQSGEIAMDAEKLAGLSELAGTLGTVATALGAVAAVAGVVIAIFKTYYKIITELRDSIVKFTQSLMQFAKNMLSSVVGAFNAVAGAVNKAVSIVRSGAEIIVSALRKIGDFGKTIVSIFGKVGNAFAPAIKGMKALLLAVSPSFVKTLASSNFQLSKVIKQTHILKGAIKSITRYFSMLTRMLMRKSITAFLNAMKQAFEDMVLFEKHANDEMLQLNYNVSIIFSALRRLANQTIAIFEPLINAIASPVENFLTMLTGVAENISKFMAILTGQPYYLRAKKFFEDYGQNVEDANKKVKNLTNGLDELNILNDKKDNKQGILPEDMFEKVPVDGTFDGIKVQVQDILDWMKDKLRDIDWDALQEKARNFVKRLFEIVNTVLRDKEFWATLGKTVGEIVNYLFAIINEAVHDLDWKALGQAITTFLKGALETIDWALIRDTVVTLAKGLADMWNEIFADKQLWKDIGSTVAHVINDVIVAYLDTFAWSFNFKNMADSVALAIKTALEGINWSQVRHAVDGWTKGITDAVNQWARDTRLWNDIGNTIKHIINDIFINAFSDFSRIDFSSLTENLKNAITRALDIDWATFRQGVKGWASNIADVINGVFADEAFLSKVTTSIAKFGNTIFEGLHKVVNDIKAYDIGSAIQGAIQKGLNGINWDEVFKFPADVVNKVSSALRGIFDSLPADFNLGKWLAEHLSITMEHIDWNAIERNVNDFSKNVVDTINGFLNNDRFWNNANVTLDKAIKVVIKFIEPILDIDLNALAKRVKDLVNSAINSGALERTVANAGQVVVDLIVAVDIALKGIKWGDLAKQISTGVADAIDKIFANKNNIKKMIQNAFGSFSTTIEETLKGMIDRNSFSKLADIIGETLLGIVTGAADFFGDVADEADKAMKQFSDRFVQFLKTNEKTIVKSLNTIIDGIVAIVDSFWDETSDIHRQMMKIVKQLKLGKLKGMLISISLRMLLLSLEQKDAISQAVLNDLDELAKEIAKVLMDYIPLLLKQVAKIMYTTLTVLTFATNPFMGVAMALGALVASLIKKAFADKFDFSNTFDDVEPKGLDNGLASFFGKIKKKIEDFVKKIKDFFGGKKSKDKYSVPVDVTPEMDDSYAKTWEDLFDEKKKVPITLKDPKLGTITASLINTDEIASKILVVEDIFADRLHVKDVDFNSSGFFEGSKKMGETYAGNGMNVGGGTLTQSDGLDYDRLRDTIVEALNIFYDAYDWKKFAENFKSNSSYEDAGAQLAKAFNKNVNWRDAGWLIATGFGGAYDWENFGRTMARAFRDVLEDIDWAHFGEIIGRAIAKQLKDIKIDASTSSTSSIFNPFMFGGESYDERDYGDAKYYEALKESDFASDYNALSNTTLSSTKVEPPIYTGSDTNTYKAKTISGALQDVYIKVDGKDYAITDGLSDDLKWKILSRNLKPVVKNSALDSVAEDKLIEELKKKWGNPKKGVTGNSSISTTTTSTTNAISSQNTGSFSDMFLGNSSISNIRKRLNKLGNMISGFFMSVEKGIRKFRDSLKGIFDGIADEFLNGLSEKADMELSKVLDIVRYYVAWIQVEFDKLNNIKLFKGISDNVNQEMARVLDLVKAWLDRIKQALESFKAPNILTGVAVGFQNELDNAYDYLVRWADRAKAKIDEIFAKLNEKLDGVITFEAHATTDSWNNATSRLIDAINALINKLGNIKCECTCCCNCNGCGNNDTPAVAGAKRDSGNSSTGGSSNSSSTGKSSGSSSSSTSGSSGGSSSTGGKTGGSASDGNGIVTADNGKDIFLYTNYGKVGLFALVDGQLVRLTDDLPIGLRRRIADGEFPITDSNGKKIGSGDRRNVLDFLKFRWGSNGDSSSSSTGGTAKTPSTGGTSKTPSTNGTNNTVGGSSGDSSGGNSSDSSNGNTSDSTKKEKKEPQRTSWGAIMPEGTYEEDGILYNSNGTIRSASYEKQKELEEKRKKELEEKKQKEQEEAKKKSEAKREENNKNTPAVRPTVLDSNGKAVTSGDAFDKASKEANAKVESLRSTGKALYDSIKSHGTDEQKKQAESYYNSLMTNRGYTDASPYEFNVKELQKLADKSLMNSLGDLKDARIGINGSVRPISSLSKEELATVIQSSKDNSGSAITFFKKGNGTGNSASAKDVISDAESIEKIKAFIRSTYGINENSPNDLKTKANNNATSQNIPSAVTDALNKYIEVLNKYNVKLGNIPREAIKELESLKTGYGTEVEFRNKDTGAKQLFDVYGVVSGNGGERYDISKFYNDPAWEFSDFSFTVGGRQTRGTKSDFENWYSNSFLVRGFQMGGIPNTGELFVARENGKPEFVGSFGNKAAVANNEQIVTAVANGVSMANESIKNAIENQTNILADTINNKDVNVQIGDRQIAEANNRGQKGLGNRFVD